MSEQSQMQDVRAPASPLGSVALVAARPGRRRFQRTGCLYEDHSVWRLRFYEDVLQPDGSIRRVRVSTALGLCVGEQAIGRREAEALAAERLRRVNKFDALPESMMTVRDFVW